jgi:hypothetical protein
MPLPFDAHYVNSKRKADGIRLSDGNIVSRTAGENLGANQLGYRNEKDYRARKAEAELYVNSVLNGRQGQRDLDRARKAAKKSGKPFDLREYRKVVIALKNTPRSSKGIPENRNPGSPLDRFQTMMGNPTWVRTDSF